MTDQRWQAVNEMLHNALAQPLARRDAFLNEACAGDVELRREVESLLRFQSDAEAFLEAPPAALMADLAAEQLPVQPQRIGMYEVVSELGRGGMGVVYLARDNELQRQVALKVLPAHLTQDADRIRRFRQEARAVSALNHPNILTLFELGTTNENETTHFIATEYVEGRTLRNLMTESNLTLGQVLEVALQTASALAAAHEAGIIHRDIKPENLMLRPDGLVKVLDFGVAKLLKKDEGGGMKDESEKRGFIHPSSLFSHPSSHPSTLPGQIIGTTSYMSPEQARGLNVDARSDIFSLGIILYEMLTGHAPFAGATTSDTLVAILDREPLPLRRYAPQLPAALQDIINHAIAKDCAQRYQCAADLHDALKDLQEELKLAARLKRTGDTPTGQAAIDLRVGNAFISTAEATTVVTTPDVHRTWFRRHASATKFAALILLILCLGALLFFGRALYRSWMPNTNKEIRSIAVLPFVNVGGDPQMEYLSDGLTESLMQRLQQLPEMQVMARGTVFTYKGREVDPRQIGQALPVQAVISGRMQEKDEQLLIRVELADAQNGIRLWGADFRRPMKELAILQSDLAHEVSAQLAHRSSAPPGEPPTQQTRNGEAYRLYLLGRFHANKNGYEDVTKALAYYQQAIDRDPTYALAYTGIADAYTFLSNLYLDPQEAMSKARQAAMKALELNNSLAEAHHSLAIIKCWSDWDWQGAEVEFKRALALNPNLANTHALYANTLSFQRRFTEFRREIQIAHQLDPLSTFTMEMNVWGLYFERKYDEALAESEKLLALDPNYFRINMHRAKIYQQKGQLREAIAEAEKVLTVQQYDLVVGQLGHLYATTGQVGKTRQLLAQLERDARQRFVSPMAFARIHIGLGENAQALARLEALYRARSEFLLVLDVDPMFDPLRSDPRFQEMMRGVGLSK